MNFQDLYKKIAELDKPVAEAAIEECGEPMGMTPPVADTHTNPPSMSLNINAQGMDDIEELIKLITKVNPDAGKPAGDLPTLTGPGPSIATIKPELPPLKMLPDLDKEPGDEGPEPEEKGPEGKEKEDEAAEPNGEEDDIMNHLNKELKPFDDQQEKDKEQEEDQQASTSPDPEFKDADYMINKLAGGLNKPKTMTKHGYQQGDNPLAMREGDLRAQIKAELAQRLAEAKAK